MIHSGVFTGVSSEIQNDLIECIDSVIQDHIDKEIENCRFLSIQVDETTDVSYVSSDRCHFSLVVGS